jgi:hypothetical protein
VRIGVAAIDLGALRALGPSFDIGDRRKQFHALLEGWRRSKAVPVHGRQVEFVFRDYGVLSEPDKRAACIALVEDEKVFAVVADASFGSGVDCVANEKRTPLLMSESRSDEIFQRNAPWLFTLQMSQSRLLRNWIHWAHHRGALRGKTIGLYYFDDAPTHDLVNRTIRAELRRLGYRIAAEATTNSELGGPQDALAVQRFRSEGVDLAMLLRSKAGFMQQAEAQNYRPTYIESDLGFGTSDTTTSTYPAEHFNNAPTASAWIPRPATRSGAR